MNNPNDGRHALERANLIARDRETVEKWVNHMRSENMGACLFMVTDVLADALSMQVGRLSDNLEALGYEVRSVSHSLIGTVDTQLTSGEVVKLFQVSVVLFVASKGGAKSNILLAGSH